MVEVIGILSDFYCLTVFAVYVILSWRQDRCSEKEYFTTGS